MGRKKKSYRNFPFDELTRAQREKSLARHNSALFMMIWDLKKKDHQLLCQDQDV